MTDYDYYGACFLLCLALDSFLKHQTKDRRLYYLIRSGSEHTRT